MIPRQAWTLRGDIPMLLLATDAGLYDWCCAQAAARSRYWSIQPTRSSGFYAVTVATDTRAWSVRGAAENGGGLYLSKQGGLTKTFRLTGLKGEDVRRLAIQSDGPRTYCGPEGFCGRTITAKAASAGSCAARDPRKAGRHSTKAGPAAACAR